MKWITALLCASLLGACKFSPIYEGMPVQERIAMCHLGRTTILIPQEAAEGHLVHGDSFGPCNDSQLPEKRK